jgi:hypothetical protein
VPIAPFIGLVDQRPVQDLLRCANHLFVAAMVVWVHPGLPPIGKSEDTGAVRVRSREISFQGKQKQRVAAHPGLPRRSLANRRLSRPAPHCSSLPWWLGFTQARRGSANQNMTAGSPRSERVKFSGHAAVITLG